MISNYSENIEEPIRVSLKKAKVITAPNINKTHYLIAGLLTGLAIGIISLCILPAFYILVFAGFGMLLGSSIGTYKKKHAKRYEIPFNQFGK